MGKARSICAAAGRAMAIGEEKDACHEPHQPHETDDSNLPPPRQSSRNGAWRFDLLEESLPCPVAQIVKRPGPYHLSLSIRDRRLVFEIATEDSMPAAAFHLSLSPFRQVVKDYWQICESYFDAVKKLPPSQIEAIDMARRGIHNEGARVLQDRLEGKAEVDTDTARRLFTLICVLWGLSSAVRITLFHPVLL